MTPVPNGAQYYIIKKSIYEDFSDVKDDWTSLGIRDGDEVFYKVDENQKIFWWNPLNRRWLRANALNIEELAHHDTDNKVREIISTERMAEITVQIAKVLRDNGIECKFNESLNCLQHSLVKGYFDEWLGILVDSQSGTFNFWEDAHERAGITRQHNTEGDLV